MAYYSEPAMLRTWREATRRDDSQNLSDMLEAARAGDAEVSRILGEAGAGIGKALANLVNITDPEVIVVGGEAVSFGDALFDPLKSSMAARTFFASPPLLPDWEDNSWARGAAALVTQKFFDFETSGGTMGSSDADTTTSAA